MNRREFVFGSAAVAALGGCRSVGVFSETPRLRLGVISDIHITTPESTVKFRRALRYFRSRGADAVLVAGDLSDWGLRSGLRFVKEAWDDEMGGTGIAPLFVTGNHDYDGWWYGDMTLDMHLQGYSEDDASSRYGMKSSWEQAFGEPFAAVRLRTVNGFRFVSAEWEATSAATAEWLEAHRSELSDGAPFFFFRHSPLPNTVSSGGNAKEADPLREKLQTFPNCIAFNGHTHWTYADERSIWQGGFTAVSIPSMSYTSIPKGYDNGSDVRRPTVKSGMRRITSREELREAQGYFVKLYADRMVIERHDFEVGEDTSSPWIVPLPLGGVRPFSFENRAKEVPVPRFPAGAAVGTDVVNSDLRNGHWAIFVKLDLPSAEIAGDWRVFDYEVRVVGEDGKTLGMKRFLSPAFYKPRDCEPERQEFLYNGMDIPERGRYRFEIVARNCFGAESAPIVSTYRESKPGKDMAKYRKWNEG